MNGIVEGSLGATTGPSWKGRVLVLALAIISVMVIVRVRGSAPAGHGEVPDDGTPAGNGAPAD